MKIHNPLLLFTASIILISTYSLKGLVDDITGDIGSAQVGSLIFSGGASGGLFHSATTTITQNFNFLSLPSTTSTDGQIRVGGDPILHTYGTDNQNIFVGLAGNFTTTAANSTACGGSALASLTDGNANTAIGHSSLANITEGSTNIALGKNAGFDLISGNVNIMIGSGAGSAYISNESNNIILGANPGAVGESLTIRIGGGQIQQNCYIEGIYASTINSETALSTYVDEDGKLGTIVSSSRFKNNIADILDTSKRIMNLRCVSFSLKADKKSRKQFGLIVEETHPIIQELVVLDKHNKPFTVKYHALPVLMLNELQKEDVLIEKLENKLQAIEKRLAKVEKHSR